MGDDPSVLGHDAAHMLFASDYPTLGVFWTIFLFVAGVLWVMTVLYAMVDIFRSHISGVAKAAWLLFVILAPFLGVLVYLTAHGDDMARRSMTRAEARYMRADDEMADPSPS